jgi:dihydrofolate reductase
MGLKLVMAVSHDGFVAKGPTDDMRWTGSTDKQVFRLLTGTGGVVGVGRRTAELMPEKLAGRTLIRLSSFSGMNLGQFAYKYDGAWLAGGQTIAMEALRIDLVDEVHLCRNAVELGEGVRDEITPWVSGEVPEQLHRWTRAMATKLDMGGVQVEVWRRVR